MKRHSSSYYYGIAFVVLLSVVCFDAYTLIGYFSRGERVRAELTRHLGSTFSFDGHEVRVFDGLTLTNFRIHSGSDRQGDGTLFQSERVHIQFDPYQILRGRSAPRRITIRNPKLMLRQTEDGKLNIQSFIDRLPTDRTPDEKLLETDISIENGTITLRGMPFLLARGERIEPRNLHLDIRPIRNGRGLVFDGTGRDPTVGPVSVHGRYRDDQFNVKLICEHVNVGEDLVHTFAKELRDKWRKYQLTGPVTMTYQLSYHTSDDADGGRPMSQKLTVEPQGVSAEFVEFPYPVADLHGSITFRPDRIEFGARSNRGGIFLRVNGTVEGYDPDSALNVAIHAENIPIDERLYGALPPEVRSFVQKLNLSGSVNADGYVSRQEGREEIDYSIRIYPEGISGRYEEFPYPVRDLHGTVIVEPDQIQLDRLTGRPGDAITIPQDLEEKPSVKLNGVVSLEENAGDHSSGTAYELDVSGKRVPLEKTLKSILPSGVREAWDRLQPEGTGAVDWEMDQPAGSDPVGHRVDVRLNDVRLQPEQFETPVRDVTANLHYEDDVLSLSGVNGTWNDGTVRIPGGRLVLKEPSQGPFGAFQISGENLKVTPPLQKYVLQDPDLVEAVKSQGRVDFRGELRWFRNRPDDELEYHVVANVDGMAIERMLTFTEIRGKVQLMGKLEEKGDERHRVLSGGINLDHMVLNGLPVQTLQANFITRDEEVRIQDLRGQVAGGSINRGGIEYRTTSGRFDLNLDTTDMNLQELLTRLGVEEKNLSGRLSSHVQLRGTLPEQESWNGKGTLKLRNAQLWKLPIFLPVFMKLSLSQPRPFTTGDVSFRIQDKQIHVRRMQFESKTSRLLGRGQIGFDGKVDLNLQTEDINPVTIPVIGWAYDKVTGNLVTLKATGNIQDPSVSFSPLPFIFERGK